MKSHWDQLNSKLIKENSVKLGKTYDDPLRLAELEADERKLGKTR